MSSRKKSRDERPYAVRFLTNTDTSWNKSGYSDNHPNRYTMWREQWRVRANGQQYAYKTVLLKLLHRTKGW